MWFKSSYIENVLNICNIVCFLLVCAKWAYVVQQNLGRSSSLCEWIIDNSFCKTAIGQVSGSAKYEVANEGQ